jgi:2-keto-3-deoxy-L-rhamnonate aldolase RhmA
MGYLIINSTDELKTPDPIMKNLLKEKLYRGEVCFGTWITIGNPDVVEIVKNLSFAWFVFDTEHSYISIETVKNDDAGSGL